jgi:hypothetical protein
LAASFATKASANLLVDDDPLRRHADLALVHIGTEGGGIHRRIDIGIVENHKRRLAAEFQQHRLQLFGRQPGDDLADPGRAGEVDALDGGMRDQRLDHLGGVGRGIGDDVDDALRQTCLTHHLAD